MPFVLGGVAASDAFSPDDIAGLEAWLDASDTSTITGASSVEQWDDKTANGHDVSQSSGLARPATGSTTVNSLNALSFDGGDVLLGTDFIYDLGACTVFAVWSNAGGNDACIAEGRNNSNGWYMPVGNEITTNYVRSYHENDSGSQRFLQVSTAATSGGTSVNLSTFTDSGTATALRVDGVDEASDTYTRSTFTPDRLSIGALERNSTTGHISGPGLVCEILVYDSVLSSGDIDTVEEYLADKWGITL